MDSDPHSTQPEEPPAAAQSPWFYLLGRFIGILTLFLPLYAVVHNSPQLEVVDRPELVNPLKVAQRFNRMQPRP